MKRHQQPRQFCINTIENPWFDRTIMFLIAVNSALVLFCPWQLYPAVWARMVEEEHGSSSTCQVPTERQGEIQDHKYLLDTIQQVELAFIVAFAIEAGFKVIAMGLFWERNSYLRSGWNWLDMIVVVTGFADYILDDLPGLAALRLFKVLRPLRALQRVRGMRVLVQTIMSALPQMCRVFAVLLFVLIVWGIFGLELFYGSLRHQCHYREMSPAPGCPLDMWGFVLPGCLLDDVWTGNWISTGDICHPYCSFDLTTQTLDGSEASRDTLQQLALETPPGQANWTCGSLGNSTQQIGPTTPGAWLWTCEPDQQCLCGRSGNDDASCEWTDNPNYGINSFDNIISACVTIFQSITLEGWVDVMYALMDGAGAAAILFSISAIIAGAFIVMNLFLAVIADSYDVADNEEDGSDDNDAEDEELAEAASKIEHDSPFRRFCLRLAQSHRLSYLMTGAVLLNTLVLVLFFFPGRPDDYLEHGAAGNVNSEGLKCTQYLPGAYFYSLWSFNAFLTLSFIFESSVKVIGLGPRVFAKDSFNVFFVFVDAVSLVELVVDLVVFILGDCDALQIPAISALRMMRILRLLKLARSLQFLRNIITALLRSIKSVANLLVLVVVMIVIFALLGMELFGGFFPRVERGMGYVSSSYPCTWSRYQLVWPDNEDPPRTHFDSPFDGIISVFIVLSGENWNDIYFNMHEATWRHSSIMATVYFLILFFVGNLLLFNLFIAILIAKIDGSDDDDKDDEGDEPTDAHGELADASGERSAEAEENEAGVRGEGKQSHLIEFAFGEYYTSAENSLPGSLPSVHGGQPSAIDDSVQRAPAVDAGGDKSLGLFSWDHPLRRKCAQIVFNPWFEFDRFILDLDGFILVIIITSSILLGCDWPGYHRHETIVKVFKWFDLVFTLIFVGEMLLKIIVFGFIRAKKTEYAPGVPAHPAYLRNAWNILDFAVVIISIISVIGNYVDGLSGLSFLVVIRTLRALRPLRLISRMEGMRVVVNTLLSSVPQVSTFAIVALLFFVIFGIMFMQFFGGKLGYCLDPLHGDLGYGSRVTPGLVSDFLALDADGGYKVDINQYGQVDPLGQPYNRTQLAALFPDGQNDYDECMLLPKYNLTRYDTLNKTVTDPFYTQFPVWVQPNFGSFDHLGLSFLLLFEIAALEGWPDVLFWLMDADVANSYIIPYRLSQFYDPDRLFGQEHEPARYPGFILVMIWVVLGCFVLINMVIGIVLDSFDRRKTENEGVALMTPKQRDWVFAQKMVIAFRPLTIEEPPEALWRTPFYNLTTSSGFDLTVMCVILLNMLFMCGTVWMPNPHNTHIEVVHDIMKTTNIIFLVLYIIEMVLKWLGLGFKQYFASTWNRFDFVLVLIQAIDIAIEALGSSDALPVPPSLLRVVRLFRVVRILRILKTAKNLRTIIQTVRISIPAMGNITILLLLLLYIFSAFAHHSFWAVNYTPNVFWNNYGGGQIFKGAYYYSNENSNNGDFVNRHAHFRDMWVSMLTLFRCATGESFNGIMHDLMSAEWGDNRLRCCPTCGPLIEDENGVPEAQNSCGQSVFSIFIFVIYQFIMGYIVLGGLFIGVIVNNFTSLGSDNKAVTIEQLEEFREVWLRYDPKGTYVVPSHNLLAILQQVPAPLGMMGKTYSRAEMLLFLGDLDIPDHNGCIHFVETLTALTHKICGVPVPICETTLKIQRQASKVQGRKNLDKAVHNALTNYLVSLLQSRWRGYTMRKKYAK